MSVDHSNHWVSGETSEESAVYWQEILHLYGLTCWRDGTEIYGPSKDALVTSVVMCMEDDSLSCNCLKMHLAGELDLMYKADVDSSPLHRLCAKFVEILSV